MRFPKLQTLQLTYCTIAYSTPSHSLQDSNTKKVAFKRLNEGFIASNDIDLGLCIAFTKGSLLSLQTVPCSAKCLKSLLITISFRPCRCLTNYDGRQLGPLDLLPLKTWSAERMSSALKGKWVGLGFEVISVGTWAGRSKIHLHYSSQFSVIQPSGRLGPLRGWMTL